MSLVDASGLPMRRALTVPAAPRSGDPVGNRRQYRAALAGGSIAAYDAADPWNRDMRDWRAWLGSPDTEGNPYRDILVARIRDLVRNDGWASGAITKLVDQTIGGHFRLIPAPAWRALRRFAPGFDEVWAKDFAEAADALWRDCAEDPIGLWFDISRRHTFSEMTALAFRQRLVDGDEIIVSHWEPDRVGAGLARYATCFQLMDADRLSNPYMQPDQPLRRGGVQIDEYGAAVSFHFRRAHQADWFEPGRAYTWEEVDRETVWGRPIVIHDFDSDRPAQHRGAGGVLRPIVGRLRMLGNYDATELQAAVVNATLAAYIESPLDHNTLAEVLGTEEPGPLGAGIRSYTEERDSFHAGRELTLNGVRIPTLFPNEKINTVAATRPNGNFEGFEGAALRNISSAIAALSSPQVSGNWMDVNYSSARAAIIDAGKSMSRMRTRHAHRVCTPIYANCVEEWMNRDELPLPSGAPEFLDARNAYSGCRWMGPGRGWVDPLNERRGAVLGLDAGFDTLENVCAEQGLDWRDVVAQRAVERAEFDRLGLPYATWQNGEDVSRAAAAPEAQ